jgi:hypothetical protein
MKVKLLTFSCVALMLFVLSTSVPAKVYMYGFVPGGFLGGGLRFDLGQGMVTDIALSAASGSSGSTYSVYADIFKGAWGLGLTLKKTAVNSDIAFDINLQYALDKNINDSITLGISAVLLNYDTTEDVDPNLTVVPVVMPYFVLAF